MNLDRMRKKNNKTLTPFYLLFFFLSLTILTTAQSPPPPPFEPVDHITLSCGSNSIAKGPDDRIWKADTNTTFWLIDEANASIPSPASPPVSQMDRAPYLTARLSRSPFSYIFPVTSGPKFIRLYFYPANYDGINSSNVFFSVQAGAYTLIRNFSVTLHAQALRLPAFYKEFCLNVEQDQRLNLTFTPAADMRDAYALVNAIEILSMPQNLYYTAEGDPGMDAIDQPGLPRRIDNTTAMELIYRLNVGGKALGPSDDTGMFRNWENDEEYLAVDVSSTQPVNTSIDLKYTSNAKIFTAPKTVYQTARSMGSNKTINDQYFLTWEFKVDSTFTYFVRLHFCEFLTPLQTQGDRKFQIWIANMSADSRADVIYWSGGNGIPTYRDYSVTMGATGNQKIQKLYIALHTNPARLTSYSDAILNGLEIFKLSSYFNLAGPNPDVTPVSPPNKPTPSQDSTNSKSNKKTIATIVGSAISGFVALSLLLFFIFQRRLKVKDSAFSDSTKPTKTHGGSSLPSDLCRRFSLAEIIAATNCFDDVFIIGVGGFGNVYKGLINDGATSVAIKRLNRDSQQGANEFKTEIEMLSQLRHLHLVSLIGYCNEDQEMILVYDYMARGTLREHLYKSNNPPLSWNQRLEICIGAARGLLYLHSGAKHTVIHRDVKTTNILLDEKWLAKVSDFGLSKMGPANMANAHVSTVVKGSFGYLDPEYYRLQRLTEKSDVYSFGVVLCEVLCARPPVNRTTTQQPASLAEWVRQSYRNETLNEIIDPHLYDKIAPECLKKFAEIVVFCLRDTGMERPSMSDVVWVLEFALQLQENAEKQRMLDGETQIELGSMKSPLIGSSIDDSDDLFSNSSGLVIDSRISGITITSSSDEQSQVSNSSQKMMSGAVFSEIMNPTGR